MRSSEWVSFAYFATLGLAAWARPLPLRRRLTITAIGAAMCAAVVALSRTDVPIVRDWSPAPIILVGYYLSGRFFLQPSIRLESWLMAWDHRLLSDPTTRFASWPRVVLAYLDLVYMGCFLLVPAGFAALVLTGHGALGNRYWTMVIAAEFGAFAPLAFIQTRPPWALEQAPATDPAVRQFASQMVQQFTIRVNTFPSGHAAGSIAVALGVGGALPWTGVALMFLALSICLACVVGRYHYVVDVVAGAALAFALWLVI
ncbi:MAG: phosphatase PAP2 family protein [Vicinamibacterales bacterium]